MTTPNARTVEGFVEITILNCRDKDPIHAENLFHDLMEQSIEKKDDNSRIAYLSKLYITARKIRVARRDS